MNSPYAVRPFQRLFALLRMDRREIIHIYLFAFVRGAIMLSVPLGFQAIINFISGGQVATSWGIMIAFVTIGIGLTGVMQVMELKLSEHIKQRLFVRSALEFAYRMPRIRTNSATGGHLPELVNRFFDTMTVQKGLNKVLVDVPVAALQIFLGMLLLAFYHPFFIGFGVSLVLLLYLIFRISGKRGMETSLKESTYKYRTAFWLEELGRHNSTFKLAGLSGLPMGRADELATGYTRARKDHFGVLLGYYWSLVGFKVVVTLALLVLGGLLVINEQMNIGQFVAAEIVILLVLNSVEKVILGLEAIHDVLTALEKMGEVTDLPLELQQGLTIPVTMEEGGPMAVDLRKVSFKSTWTGTEVLKDLDLTIRAGEKICISGPSGAGKSTLLHLIAGLMVPDAGTVAIDGNGFRSLALENVRSAMGDSFTQEEVFSGTILENIITGRPWITETDARRAAERSGLMRLLGLLPNGLLTVLDPLGSRLPQSLLRRIIITRCIAGRPRLVLFEDDALLLPVQDQEEILELLTGPEAGFTLIAVSNDPKLHARCDRVIRLQEGSVVTEGRTII